MLGDRSYLRRERRMPQINICPPQNTKRIIHNSDLIKINALLECVVQSRASHQAVVGGSHEISKEEHLSA